MVVVFVVVKHAHCATENTYTISAKDKSRLHQFGPRVSSVMYCMRVESGKETFWSQTLRIGGDGRIRTHARKLKRPPQSGIVQNEERNKKFFEENQTDSLLQPHIKMTQHGMMRKLKMTSGLLRETSFIAITWNPESNCTCRMKNHFQFQ